MSEFKYIRKAQWRHDRDIDQEVSVSLDECSKYTQLEMANYPDKVREYLYSHFLTSIRVVGRDDRFFHVLSIFPGYSRWLDS